MYVICQNDYPLVIVNNIEEVAEQIKNEIQRRCDEISEKNKNNSYGMKIYIHMRKVPIINEFEDINNKLYWNDWNIMVYPK